MCDEGLANRLFRTIEDLERAVADRVVKFKYESVRRLTRYYCYPSSFSLFTHDLRKGPFALPPAAIYARPGSSANASLLDLDRTTRSLIVFWAVEP